MRTHTSCVRRRTARHAYAYLSPETLIQHFLLLFLYSVYMFLSYFMLLESLFLCLLVVCSLYVRLGFPYMFSLIYHEHAFT